MRLRMSLRGCLGGGRLEPERDLSGGVSCRSLYTRIACWHVGFAWVLFLSSMEARHFLLRGTSVTYLETHINEYEHNCYIFCLIQA